MKDCAQKIWEETFLWFKQITDDQFMQCYTHNWFIKNVLCEQKKDEIMK